MAGKASAAELAPLRDSMVSASSDYAMDESFLPSASYHMGHGHMGLHPMSHRHRCLIEQTFRWLCAHREVIRTALMVEVMLCVLFAAVHMIWSCCLKTQSSEQGSSNPELKAPLIESASAYMPAEDRVIISPLWAHVMNSKSEVSLV